MKKIALEDSIARTLFFIHTSADIGGTEISSFQLISRLDRRKFTLHVLFHCDPGPILESYKRAQIPYDVVPFPKVLPVFKLLRRMRPDVIQIYGLRTNVLWRPLLYLTGHRKLIGVIQGLTNTGERPSAYRIFFDRLTQGFLTFYVANSQRLAEHLERSGFSRDRLRIIFNGIEVPPRTALARSHQPPVIACVGNLRAVKGHRYLLEACKILKDRGTPFETWIVGDGELCDVLRSLAGQLGIDQEVKFLGRVPRVEDILKQVDIFALLSLSEGIPGAVMEAMSLGLPVVATSVGGVSELVEDGKEGFLIPSREPGQAADRLSRLLSDPAARQAMGDRAYDKIRSLFNISETVRAYEQLYETA